MCRVMVIANTDASMEMPRCLTIRRGMLFGRGMLSEYSAAISTPRVANADSHSAVLNMAYGVVRQMTKTATESDVMASAPLFAR